MTTVIRRKQVQLKKRAKDVLDALDQNSQEIRRVQQEKTKVGLVDGVVWCITSLSGSVKASSWCRRVFQAKLMVLACAAELAGPLVCNFCDSGLASIH